MPDRWQWRGAGAPLAALTVAAGAAVWAVALILGPVIRPDLDPLTAHPEAYATGHWAALMRAGYVGVAIAGGAAAWLDRRHPITAMLFALFATGALAIGVVPPTGEGTPGDVVFPFAQLAPLAFLPAAAWVSWRDRRPALRSLAALVWLLFLPLVAGEPPLGGMLNRVADLAIAGWLATFALAGRRSAEVGPAA